MAEELTLQQRTAVYDRGGKLLVSAAAGSGKTKVLVDRLLSYLMDPDDPAQLDEFLIITYTKAAAAELRGKIAAKLSQRMASDPENRHLQRQMQRLYLAKIATVHSFCVDILKEYAYILDLPADLRVADENECQQLRDRAVQAVLEDAYLRIGGDADLRSLVDTQGLGRDDRLLNQLIFKVYDSARCHTDPEKWLQKCVDDCTGFGAEDACQTVWGEYLVEDLQVWLDLQLEGLSACTSEAQKDPEMAKPAALLQDTLAQLTALRQCSDWDSIRSAMNIDFGRLVFSKKCTDADLIAKIKAVRSACKDGLEKKKKNFSDDNQQVLSDLRTCASSVRGLAELTRRFGREYDRLKAQRRILDFGDLEQHTLDLLLGKKRQGITKVAREIAQRFREILVDEYQDSNAVQDGIFSALSDARGNCFMVGDVKQSIYQFRLADPKIFLEKYRTFVPAEKAVPMQGRKVLLSKNFRSAKEILAGVNDIFRSCMSRQVGGLDYGDDEALVPGRKDTVLQEPAVEFWAVDVQEHTYTEEPAFVAKHISQLLDGNHLIPDGEGSRPITADDIVILLRSPGSVGSHYLKALAGYGIRCTTGGGEDLLKKPHIQALRSLLQCVSNPRQDIPLVAALSSPLFAFTADDLAVMRTMGRKGCLFDALTKWENPKAESFLDVLTQLRDMSRLLPLNQLLELAFRLTHIESIYGAMSDGAARVQDIYALFELASGFEAGGYRDLEQFLEHLDAMEERGLITAGEQASGAVTVMSIHKSKGLEFPVVIVAGLARSFNREDLRVQVLCDQTLGIGLSGVDVANRLRYPTISKRAIAAKTVSDSISEELRVLYVALTRAKERLIMSYASRTLEKDITDMVSRMDVGKPELITAEVSCPGEWVLFSALRRAEAGCLFELGGRPVTTQVSQYPWRMGVVRAASVDSCAAEDTEAKKALPAGFADSVRSGLAFRYPHPEATVAPSKQTATQRKGRIKDEEVQENTQKKSTFRSWRKPSFAGGSADATDYGSAIHAALQFIRYAACTDEAGVIRELDRLVQERYLTQQQRDLVDPGKLFRFFATPLGQRLQKGQVLREFKFSILDDGAHFDAALQDEKILLQGVVDCALIEADGITVVDFKTDSVTEGTLQDKVSHYRPQVLAYRDALQRIYELPVKESYLYFFGIDAFVKV